VDKADLVEFASRGLMTNAAFDKHPDVARVIAPNIASAAESSLADRFALIEDRVWDALLQPANLEQKSRP
jgi:hypothetical protein